MRQIVWGSAILHVFDLVLAIPLRHMIVRENSVNGLRLLLELREEELLRLSPILILFHRTLQDNAFSGNVVFAGRDTVEEPDGLPSVDGDLRSGSLQGMEAFEG